MKRLLLLMLVTSLTVSCAGKRHIEKAMYSGNYDHAITDALKRLRTNKDAKRKTKFVMLLAESYHKVMERDLQAIERLKKAGDIANSRIIYNIYLNMDSRQEAIKPYLPLRVGKKTVKFRMLDLTNQLVMARDKAVEDEYAIALQLMNSENKFDFRDAYGSLSFIQKVNPEYKNVRALMDEAHFKGTDFILVSVENNSNQFMPFEVEQALLDFNTYGLNNFWAAYHEVPNKGIDYDFALELLIDDVQITPERVFERQFLREKQVVDGWEYQLDANGNVMQDSLGNDIKIDRIINARCRFFEIEQHKATRISARAIYTDLKTQTRFDSYPLASEFVFSNVFGRARGDRRALNNNDLRLLENRRLPFPTHSQMVVDTAQDLKARFKDILNNYPVGG